MNSSGLLQIIFLLLFIVPAIFFIITLQNTLKIISPENRKMPAANVWFVLIPLFGFVWQFIIVTRLSDSIKLESERLNILVKESRPTYNIGIAYCVSSIIFLIPVLKIIGALAVLVTWVLYWIDVNKYKKLLLANKNNYLLDAEQDIFHP